MRDHTSGIADAESWRPMSVTCQVFYQLGRLINANSSCVLVLRGTLDVPRLRSAAAMLAHRHPLLRSVVERRGGRLGWRLLSSPAPSEIPLQRHQINDEPLGGLLEGVVQAAWHREFELSRDTPFALNLFESPARTALQIVTSHVAEDAHASYQISRDLADLYDGCDQDVNSVVLVHPPDGDMDAYLMRSIGPVRATEKLRGWRHALRDLIVRDAVMPIHPSTGTALQRAFAMTEIDIAMFESLRRTAKTNGCTVHNLLLLATCRVIDSSLADRRSPAYIRLLDMFSVRAHAGYQASALYENLVLPYPIRVRRGGDLGMLSQIRQRVEAMKRGAFRMEWFRCAVGARLLGWIRSVRLLRWVVRRTSQATVLITNPGRIPFELARFGGLVVEEFFTHAQLFPPGALMCQLSGLGDRLRLLFVYEPEAFTRGGLDFEKDFREPLLQELKRISSGLSKA